MAFYEEMQGIATDLFAEFKQGNIVYVRMLPGSGPVDDPGEPVPQRTKLDGAARGVQFKFVAKGLAVGSDKQVSCHVNPAITPNKNDFIEIDGVSYKIMEFIPKPSAGVAAAWLFIVRKGA